MNRIVSLWREEVGQDLMRLLPPCLFGAQADAATDAVNVRVHREGWHAKRKLHHDCGCLGPDPLQFHQPIVDLVRRQLPQEVEFDLTAFLGDRTQGSLDARPLLISDPRDTDCINHLFRRSVAHLFPGWKSFTKAVETTIAIDVICVLGQDG